MTIEIREGRGVGPHKDHILLHLEHLGAELLHERLPGISETAKIFAGVDVTQGADPGAADRPLQHGRHPDQLSTREVLNPTAEDQDASSRGLMAVGEAACVSVHGANRLGTNSLLDLVVFGRAAAHRAAETIKPGASPAAAAGQCRGGGARPARPRPQRQGRHPGRRAAGRACSGPCRPMPRCSAPPSC